ncbi:type III PLP-dependent enzyme [Rhizomicrobium palustre]
MKPGDPVYVLEPAKFRASAERFLKHFPGTPMYAVKANPTTRAMDLIWQSGIRHFDTASFGEVKMVKERFPEAVCHFMAPVRLPGHAKAAFEQYGVTDYVVDCEFELEKLLSEIEDHSRLRIFVRLAAALGGALLELSSKFGTNPDEGARLLNRVVAAGAQPAATFHVGSQCLSPFSYAQAVEIVRRTIDKAGVKITALDIGGGFPAPLLNNDVPPFIWYFDTIREAIETLDIPDLQLLCEPGRALVTEGLSVVTQVVLRKGDRLYLNDGTYGSFDELTLPGFNADYPSRAFRLSATGEAQPLTTQTTPFRVYGPTCDTLDVLPRPQMLPEDIKAGDFIVFDNMGAYTVAVRTNFNGFYNDTWVQVGA